MITQLLLKSIEETEAKGFTISEFQLGEAMLKLLKKEVEATTNLKVDLSKINFYRGIPIIEHDEQYRIMFAVKIKKS